MDPKTSAPQSLDPRFSVPKLVAHIKDHPVTLLDAQTMFQYTRQKLDFFQHLTVIHRSRRCSAHGWQRRVIMQASAVTESCSDVPVEAVVSGIELATWEPSRFLSRRVRTRF